MRVEIDDPEFDQAVKELPAATGEPEDISLKVAYALAKSRSEPLLFKGDDFQQTDVLVA